MTVSFCPPNSGFDDVQYAEARAAAIEYLEQEGYWTGSFVEQRVAWGDMDSNRHVNNVRYVRVFISMVDHTDKVSLILAGMDKIKWIRAVMYPDVCMVAHRFVHLDKRTIVLEGIIYSYKQRRAVLVCTAKMSGFDYEAQKAADLPEKAYAAVERVMRNEQGSRKAKL